MSTILATLITLSVLAGIATSANALDRRGYNQLFSTGQGSYTAAAQLILASPMVTLNLVGA